MRRLPDRGLQIALGLLVLVTSFFATALPGVSTARYDQAASTALDGATLSVEGIGIPTPYLSSDAELANAGGIMRGLAQEPLLGPPTHEVGSFHSPPERSPQYRLHWSPATGGRVRYVVGRAPRTEADQPGKAVQEAGMAVAAARKHGLEPGDMIDIRSDGSNPHIRISGLYEPIDRKDPYWTEQGELLDAYPLPIPNGEALAAALVLDSAAYTSIVEDTDLLLWFRWRFPVDSEGASADQVVSAGAALKDMSTGLGSFGMGGIDLRLGGDLESRVSEFPGRLRVVQAVLALALSGLWAVAAGVLVLVCRLLAERMREYLAVMRARGASLVQLAALVCGMTAWTAVPGALIGFGLGLLVDSRHWSRF